MDRRLRWLAVPVLAGIALLWPARPGPDAMPPAGHEATDVGFRAMLYAGLGMAAGLAAMLGLALWLFPAALKDKSVPLPLPQFPAPQLQNDPAADMAAFRAQQLRQLNTAYWLDADHKTLHLPIAQAMQDVARRGIPDWPTR